MSHRRLGQTNVVISEVNSGCDPITSENWQHLNLAIENGGDILVE